MSGRVLQPGPQMNGGPVQMQVAVPFNDVQLVAFVAAHLYFDDAKDAVSKAVEIVAQACVQASTVKISKRVQELLAE